MKVELNRFQMDWLTQNCRFPELTDEQQQELYESIPDVEGRSVWQCPSFASLLVRDRFEAFLEDQERLLAEMNAGNVSGTLNIKLLENRI